MNLEIITNSEPQTFTSIAKELINSYTLKVNDTLIELCDLEFYWNGTNHEDLNTHKHDYSHGQLRPHISGYDIALENHHGHGGILIRGIVKEKTATYGPFLCADEIFKSAGHLGKNGLVLKLEERTEKTNHPVHATKRVNLKKESYKDAPYRFIACRSDYLYQIADKVKICQEIQQTFKGIDPDITTKALATPKRKNKNT